MARAEYNGTTIGEHGEDIDRSSNASYFEYVQRKLVPTTLLDEALKAIDQAYCAENPDAPSHDVCPVGFERVPYDHSQD